MQPLVIFIGHDDREPRSVAVTEFSIRRRSEGVITRRLNHHSLRREGLFSRPWHISAEGQYTDELDGLPFSTAFSHTRFLVPALARSMNAGRFAIFVDGDFLFLRDVHTLLQHLDEKCAVHVVKHNYVPASGLKMDGKVQSIYAKKLWSSLMLFDLAHPANLDLTPDVVNTRPGSWLHQFRWLPDDSLIGSLDPSWNHIPSFSEGQPRAIHYTEGSPEMPGYERGPLSDLWWAEFQAAKEDGYVV